MYPNTKGARFDMDYYLSVHIPLAKKLFGSALKEVTIERGVNAGPPDTQPQYLVTARMVFDSVEAFYAAFMPHMVTLRSDVPKYTDIMPLIQISEIVGSK